MEMFRGQANSSLIMRATAIGMSLCMVMQSSAGVIDSILTAATKAQTAKRKTYTTAPGPIFLGKNPGREPETRGGLWTPRLLNDLRNVEFAEAIRRGESIWMAGFWELGMAGLDGGGGNGSGPPIGGEGSGGPGGPPLPGQGPNGSGNPGVGWGPGGVNTHTGNKLTAIHLVDWPSRGQTGVSLTLYHNSIGSYAGANMSAGWSHTYDMKVSHTPGSSAIVRWGDGLTVPYSEGGNGAFNRPPGFFETLVKNQDNTWTLTAKSQTKFQFNTGGFLVAIEDRNGYATSVFRDGQNRVEEVRCASALHPRKLTFEYDSESGLLTRVAGNYGTPDRDWLFEYNSGYLKKIKYPQLPGEFGVRRFHDFIVNTQGDILWHTNRNGKIWKYEYAASKCTKITTPHPADPPYTFQFTYSATNTVITVPGGQQWTHNYSAGKLASVVDPNTGSGSYSESYLYDTDRNVTQVIDRNQEQWNYTYSNGNLLTATDPLSHVTTITYKSTNEVETVLRHNETTPITYHYHANGQVKKVVDQLGRTFAETFLDGNGELDKVIDSKNRTTEITINADGDLVEMTPPGGSTATITYDRYGKPVTIGDTINPNQQFEYDTWGRPILQRTWGLGFEDDTLITYDYEDNVLSVTDPMLHQTVATYDEADAIKTVTNAEGKTTEFTYNSNGWLTAIENARGYTRSYDYTARGDAYRLTLPGTPAAIEEWSFDGNGNVTAYTNPLSETIAYLYDDADRMWKVDYPTGTDTVVTYDHWDRPLSMVDGSGTSSWTFNAADELTTFAAPQGTVNYEYLDDDGGKLKKVIEPGIGETLHEYGAAHGLLEKVTNPHGEITEHGYDAGLRPAWTKFGSGAREEFGYDDRGRMNSVVLKNDAQAVLRSVAYAFDSAGRMTSSLVDGVSTSFTHDAIGQLTSETRSGYAAGYTYDANGNRLTRTVGSVTETYATNERDELVSISVNGNPVREYTLDLAGRTTGVTTAAGTTTFAYDFEDRVTSVSYPGSGSSTYGYNGLDTRVSASGSFGSRTYRRAGAGVTAPVLGDGVSHFTPGVSVRTGSDTRYQHAGLKNIDAQSSGSQSISATRTYDAFGQTVASSGSWSGPFGYGGAFGYQSEPDSGLQLLGHRYYDPSAGRFLSRDKARDGGNWYVYCGNGPLTRADPTGTFFFLLAGAFIAGGTCAWALNEIMENPDDPKGWILLASCLVPGGLVARGVARLLPKVLAPAAKPLALIQKNLTKGKLAEKAVLQGLIKKGYKDATDKLNYFDTPWGKRLLDLKYTRADGKTVFVEVKSGTSRYHGTLQEMKDNWLRAQGIIIVLVRVP
ncbi:MAG: hypothetical protein HONBIEJF_02865 [Fimbriimonadaceae bacterium]|nr:hypothetical protein [Fimbriimonadaceae bacterium]